MERKRNKAINFDLDTNKMKEMNLYPKGYKILGAALRMHGFEHRQGSGYISKEKIDSDAINDLVIAIVSEYSWLSKCIKKIDVTDIGRQHDLTMLVKEIAEMDEKLSQENDAEDLDNLEENDSPTLTM